MLRPSARSENSTVDGLSGAFLLKYSSVVDASRLRRKGRPPHDQLSRFSKTSLTTGTAEKNIRATGIERQLRKHFGRFGSGEPCVHRAIEVISDLRHLAASDECSHSDQAAVAWSETWSKPEVLKEYAVGKFNHAFRRWSYVLLDPRGMPRVRLFV
jgi:hypothetical protein